MKSFKQYLTEASANTYAIDDFLGVYWKGNGVVPPYTLTPDGEINMDIYIQIAPRTVAAHLSSKNVKLKKLPDGISFNEVVGFSISGNELTTLKGCPVIVTKNFYAEDNKLTSLEYAPKLIGGDASFAGNPITSLHDIHKHIKEIHGEIKFASGWNKTCPIKSSVLGLLKIVGLKGIALTSNIADDKSLKEVEKILNKYLPNTLGNAAVYKCQEELIDAGFEEYAQL